MKKNKIIALGLSLVLSVGLFAGCASKAEPTANETTKVETQKKLADGTYFAQSDNFEEKSGWKDSVTLQVKDGKIISADWNGTHKNGGADKKTQSKEGKYGMKKGGSKAEWHEEAAKVEAYLIEKQNPKDIKFKDDQGHTDAISGATITVGEFFKLAEKALANGPKAN